MSKPIEGGSTAIAVSGLQAQKKRIQILAENIANLYLAHFKPWNFKHLELISTSSRN